MNWNADMWADVDVRRRGGFDMEAVLVHACIEGQVSSCRCFHLARVD